MEIPRTQLLTELEAFAFKASGVVIGAPGAGKSHTLRLLCSNLVTASHPVLFVPIDKLGPIEREEDLRAELGFSGDLITYLKQQKALIKGQEQRPGLLVVDAFDAARSDAAQQLILTLIKAVQKNLKDQWHVLVSVRTYDAQKSIELQELFPPAESSAAFQQPDIICRHFHIPLLSEAEVADAVVRNRLKEAHDKAALQLRDLLRIPFNLWLLCRLVELGVDTNELTAIRSEVELLGLFWRHRISGADAVNRELLLSAISKKMVEAKSLSVRKDSLPQPIDAAAWKALLSSEVLAETRDGQRVLFSHNILFDYAVSVLLIEDSFEHFSRFLSEDKSRLLFLRPSLHYYFARIWYRNTPVFWDMFWKLLKSDDARVRLAARLLPARIIAEEAATLDDLRPALQQLAKDEAGAEAIARILEALRALGLRKHRLWAEFLLATSKTPARRFVWEVANLAVALLDHAQKTSEQDIINIVGEIGRNLQSWIWANRKKGDAFLENLGAQWAVRLITRTYSSNVAESRKLLAPILELPKEPDFPIDYLYRLTHELKAIIPHDADFTHAIYLAVFKHNETSEEKTSMGTPVVAMSSTRRQDYSMCKYALVERFPEYVKAYPVMATKTYLECLNEVVIRKHLHLREGVSKEDVTKTFPLAGKTARLMRDGSAIWDQGYRDDSLKMADTYFSFLRKEAQALNAKGLLRPIVEAFAEYAVAAFHWRHLLTTASATPDAFANLLQDVCLARPVQTSVETVRELGLYLEAASSHMSAQQREAVEKSILSLTAEA